MVKVSRQVKWFLAITRYGTDGRRNQAIQETIGFCWLGPLVVIKLEKRGSKGPLGMTSPQDTHVAISTLELYDP